MILRPEDAERLAGALGSLCETTLARAVFLVDRDGHLLAQVGEAAGIDSTALASLAAGSLAATGGLAALVGEREFGATLHEGAEESLYLSPVGSLAVLVVRFDRRSPLGLVRLRVRQAGQEIGWAVAAIAAGPPPGGPPPPGGELAQLSDEEIEKLLNL